MNICFICTGNTCRSPLAEGILKSKNLPGISVRSAGVYAMNGGPISGHSQQLLDENGMTASLTSKKFTMQEAEWADLILTMTSSHKEILQRMIAGESYKVFTLKEYVGESEFDVQDPYGGNSLAYQQTFDELSTLIDVLARKLMEEQKLHKQRRNLD